MKKWFKNFTFKEEVIAVLIGAFGLYLINVLFTWLFPQSALFDLPSELENIVYSLLRFMVNVALGWVGVRVIFPAVYRFIKQEFYIKFPELDMRLKYILATVLFCVFTIVAAISSKAQEGVRHTLLQNLTEQLNVREVTANSSPEIDAYLSHVGFDNPAAWCAAFVGYNLSAVGVDNPQSAWSPNYARAKDVIWYSKSGYMQKGIKALTGDVVTFYYSRLGRVGHVGFYIKTDKSGYFITIEGNTNANGSRTGDGVYMKKRHPRKTHAISRYIKEV